MSRKTDNHGTEKHHKAEELVLLMEDELDAVVGGETFIIQQADPNDTTRSSRLTDTTGSRSQIDRALVVKGGGRENE